MCLYFGSMLILCNIFVKLEHFILFKNFEKYHNFIYYMINIKLMVHSTCQDVVMLRVLHIIFKLYFCSSSTLWKCLSSSPRNMCFAFVRGEEKGHPSDGTVLDVRTMSVTCGCRQQINLPGRIATYLAICPIHARHVSARGGFVTPVSSWQGELRAKRTSITPARA